MCCTLPLLCFLPLLSWSVHREKCPNSSTTHWSHSACTSVSMFPVNVDNCLFLCSCFSPGLCVHIGFANPFPSSARHLHLVVECGVHGQQNTNPANLQCCRRCCCSTEAETGLVPTSGQLFAVGTFLTLRSPSWTRSCIQKYRASMCFSPCPAPNRSVKEFAVGLSLCISIFIGIPRSWYIDIRDIPT